ncbi:MAG: APC family permease [Gracilimonas sp.]|uniref:APC family permease n=1 Tax=Gracilimonas sp. TaxID=1974203 RepID=UPI003752555A|nr:APC family permease [Gracilimonas sp.]
MATEKLGLKECVSIALGGMIGGGIFAVLGVVAQIVQAATWFAFVLAGIVALCAAYSYNKLNSISKNPGGSVSMIQCCTGNTKLAGMAGWTLLFGYIGSMAMYAYAFGSYTVGFDVILDTLAGLPARPLISVLVVAAFLRLNLAGARATGSAENLMVGIKVLILLAFGIGGVWLALSEQKLELGLEQTASFGPIMAAAVSFVAFQGWQLLFYDREGIKDPDNTIRKAVYIAIVSAVGIYILVALTTLSLAPMEVIREDPERALAVAAEPLIPYGFTIISLAALFSTGSAINATLFSSGYFAKGMLSDHLLPDQLGSPKAEGIPNRTLIILSIITAAFTVYGSLDAITSFASLTFIIIFGAMSYLAFRQRHRPRISGLIPAVGMTGTAAFFVLMFWHLYNAEPETFYSVLIIAVLVITVELLYFERDILKRKIIPLD